MKILFSFSQQSLLQHLLNCLGIGHQDGHSIDHLTGVHSLGGDVLTVDFCTGQSRENLSCQHQNLQISHIRGDHVSAQSHWVDLGVDAIAAALPFVPAGTTKALKAADKGVDAVQNAKTVDNVSFSVSSVLKNRVKLRNETKQAVRNAAPKTKDGKFIDPNTLQPIEKGQEVFGHKYGHEWYQYKRNPANQNKTRKDVIKDQNEVHPTFRVIVVN